MVSGYEISEGDRMIAIVLKKSKYDSLNDGAFQRYYPVSPPIFGTYGDYGRIDVNDTPAAKTLFMASLTQEGECPDEIDKEFVEQIEGAHLFFALTDALDMLRTVRHEFSYGDNAKTCGESETRLITDTKEKAVAHALRKLDPERLGFDAWEWDTSGQPVIQRTLKSMMNQDSALIDLCSERMGLITLLQCGMTELRRLVIPQSSVGPQHGGWEAMEDYANWIHKQVAKSKSKYDYEDEDDAEG